MTSRPERCLDVGVRLGSIGVNENVTVAAGRIAYLPQHGFDVFVHRHGIVSAGLRIRHVDQSALEIDPLPREVE